jgi:hypothetical protein
MTKWQHCVLEWRSDQVTLTVYGEPPEPHELSEWEDTFARLGTEGWELVGTLASTSGEGYWFYFKRPLPA